MSGFTAPAPAPAAPAITNDGWWPDIDPADARDLLRLDGTVSAERLRDALITAIGSTNQVLTNWRTTQAQAGHASLVDVPAPTIDKQSRLVHLYQRAVFSTAAALIIERYRNYDITDDGQKEVEQLIPSIDELRRDAHWAIHDMQGLAHATVELI